MTLKRFRNTTSQGGDPLRVPSDLGTSKVPAVQATRSKLILLDDADPGYTTQHALLLEDGTSRMLSYAAEMSLITALIEQNAEHDERTAREALAQLVVAHNLRAAKHRVSAAGALDWLSQQVVAMKDQWQPSELAEALNQRDAQRRETRKAERDGQMN